MNFNKLLSFDIKFKRVANTQTGTKTSDMVDGSAAEETKDLVFLSLATTSCGREKEDIRIIRLSNDSALV